MGRSRANKSILRRDGRVFRVFLVLLFLAAITTRGVGNTYARYATEASANDEARVAVWAVQASLSDADVQFTANDQYGSTDGTYYVFEVFPNNTEVASKYGITITLTKGDSSGWPEGLTAKITNEDGKTLIKESTDGIFEDVGTFEPGGSSVKHRLYFKADYGIDCGEYDMEITARMEQTD